MIGLDPRGRARRGGPRPCPRATGRRAAQSRVAPAELPRRAVARGVARRRRPTRSCTRCTRRASSSTAAPRAAPGAPRPAAVVVVRGAGPLTLGIVIGLAAAGIGAVHLATTGERGAAPTSAPASSTTTMAGERLAAIAGGAAARGCPASAVTPWPRTVVPGPASCSPTSTPTRSTARSCVATGLAHLPVRLRDGVGVVGPAGAARPHRLPGLPRPAAQRARSPAGRWSRRSSPAARGTADAACVQATRGARGRAGPAAVDATAGWPAPPAALERDPRDRLGTGAIVPPCVAGRAGLPVSARPICCARGTWRRGHNRRGDGHTPADRGAHREARADSRWASPAAPPRAGAAGSSVATATRSPPR